MENGFESTNLMLPRKENKNMLHSVQIFIMKFKSTYGRSFSQITLLYFSLIFELLLKCFEDIL